MNYIDIIILVIIAIGAIRGFLRGLVVEVATLVALVLGVFAAMKYACHAEGWLQEFLDISPRYAPYLALGITFLLVVVAIYLLGKLLTKLVDSISLGLANKLLGTLFGALKAAIIVCVLLMITDALNEKFRFIDEKTVQKSILYQPFLNFAEKTYRDIRF